ncbi:MAG: hypothetical protein DRQ10_05725 [Candidatus Hydrothermota bacterium]|nr:MAG: hypothetical protein DRQ10_05725 [Candidatus Hydrothermae bacterium]
MKKVLIGLLVTVGLLAAQTGISGYVYDSNSNQPIANAFVKVYEASSHHPHPIAMTFTGSDGYYEFTNLQAGSYFVFASVRMYQGQFYNGAQSIWDADTVYVYDGQMTTGIDFYLIGHGGGGGGTGNCMVSGTVVDESTGEPLSFVFVMAVSNDGGHHGGHRCHCHGYTDENGQYVLNLTPGTYTIFAYRWDYQPEWYYESSTPDSATPIELNDGDTLYDINFTLSPYYTEFATITGFVIDSVTGEPIVGAVVHAHDTASHRGGQHGGGHHSGGHNSGGHQGGYYGGHYWHYGHMFAITDENGQYTLEVPAPGTYYISASAFGYNHEFYDNASTRFDATPVTVNPDDVVEIDFDLTGWDGGFIGNSTISGTVVDEVSGEPIPGAVVMGFIPMNQHRPRRVSVTVTDSLGNFLLENLPEGENVYLFAKVHGYFGEFYDDAYCFDSATAVIPPAENIVIDLVPRDSSCYGSGGIAGLVVGNDNNPFPYGAVIATDVDNGITYIDVSDMSGYYGIDELPPGTYEVAAEAIGMSSSAKSSLIGTVEVLDSYVDYDVVLTPTDVEESEVPELVEPMLMVTPVGKGRFNIEFALPTPTDVNLAVYDASGRLVRSLVNGSLPNGVYDFTFEATRSGAYFVRLATKSGQSVRKVVIVK